jgi:hypothetical protein
MATERIDLAQGTLDLLIYERWRWNRSTPGVYPSAFNRYQGMCFRFSKARCIQLYTDLNAAAGSNLVGVCPRIIAGPSITS